DRRRRFVARPRRPPRRMGRGAPPRAAPDARCRHACLPRLRARRPPPQGGGDERAVARDGANAEFRPVQSRTPDLRGVEALRYRAAVRAQMMPEDLREQIAGLEDRIEALARTADSCRKLIVAAKLAIAAGAAWWLLLP